MSPCKTGKKCRSPRESHPVSSLSGIAKQAASRPSFEALIVKDACANRKGVRSGANGALDGGAVSKRFQGATGEFGKRYHDPMLGSDALSKQPEGENR